HVRRSGFSLWALLLGASALAQEPGEPWEYEDAYDDDILYVHALLNYSYDLEWQLAWEQRLLADNGFRLNVGSVTSSELMTLADLNINQDLDEKWRFQARAFRHEPRQLPARDDQIFVGLERSIFESSSVFLMATPQYDKEFMDVYGGYTFYRNDREQYFRVGVMLEDIVYDTKNELGGQYDREPVALQWAIRLGGEDWWIFSEGKVGTGFERSFPDANASPELAKHDRQENAVRLKFTRMSQNDSAWSAWVDWYDFSEAKRYRSPGLDYEYSNTQWNFAAELIRTLRERHRLRFLIHVVQQDAASQGFNAHDYDRRDILGGAFYEYLRPKSGFMFSYVLGLPDAEYRNADNARNFNLDGYRDKLIAGWRYRFSADSQLLFSVSHEVSAHGFGGGNLQMLFFF
ncbi:MAG: hypothetical protein OEW68_17700, partial [Gammaproteobacteria bacterium]|nr:hypothetical protein [Gammaproteobacteria bacterium]